MNPSAPPTHHLDHHNCRTRCTHLVPTPPPVWICGMYGCMYLNYTKTYYCVHTYIHLHVYIFSVSTALCILLYNGISTYVGLYGSGLFNFGSYLILFVYFKDFNIPTSSFISLEMFFWLCRVVVWKLLV